MSSINIDTFVPSRLSNFRASISTSSSSANRLPLSFEPLYTINTSHSKQETFLYEYP
jgi:hypothetical protein